MRVADFFCGGGGFSEGFRQAGFEIVFAVDKWAPAVNTYKGNKPGANVIQDDVIRISNLPDDEFEALVPDSEVIIGSPPCQSFSHSNKSGNADKELGIKLIEAYLKIVARKKFKQGSVLRYWVLENVPAVKDLLLLSPSPCTRRAIMQSILSGLSMPPTLCSLRIASIVILFDRFLKKYYADIDVSNERMTINLTDEEGHVLSFNLSQSEVHYVLHMVERRLNSFMRDDGGGGFSDED